MTWRKKQLQARFHFRRLTPLKTLKLKFGRTLCWHNTEQIQDKVLALSPMKLSTAISALNALFGFRAIYWRSTFLYSVFACQSNCQLAAPPRAETNWLNDSFLTPSHSYFMCLSYGIQHTRQKDSLGNFDLVGHSDVAHSLHFLVAANLKTVAPRVSFGRTMALQFIKWKHVAFVCVCSVCARVLHLTANQTELKARKFCKQFTTICYNQNA